MVFLAVLVNYVLFTLQVSHSASARVVLQQEIGLKRLHAGSDCKEKRWSSGLSLRDGGSTLSPDPGPGGGSSTLGVVTLWSSTALRLSLGPFLMLLLCQMTLIPHKLDMEGGTIRIQIGPIRTRAEKLAFLGLLFFRGAKFSRNASLPVSLSVRSSLLSSQWMEHVL